MKKKLIFFFASLALVILLININSTKKYFQKICVNLIKIKSDDINLYKMSKSNQAIIIDEIDLTEKYLENFLRVGKFQIMTTSVNRNCENNSKYINKNIIILKKKIEKKIELYVYKDAVSKLSISLEIQNINLFPLFIFISFIFYTSIFIFLFFLYTIFLQKKIKIINKKY